MASDADRMKILLEKARADLDAENAAKETKRKATAESQARQQELFAARAKTVREPLQRLREAANRGWQGELQLHYTDRQDILGQGEQAADAPVSTTFDVVDGMGIERGVELTVTLHHTGKYSFMAYQKKSGETVFETFECPGERLDLGWDTAMSKILAWHLRAPRGAPSRYF